MHTNLLCKNVMLCVNIHMKNVNDVDFDTNINRDMCMKVMFIFIYIKLHIIDKYLSIYIMRIAICIIYVHDDVDVSVNGYVNAYIDGYVNGYDI